MCNCRTSDVSVTNFISQISLSGSKFAFVTRSLFPRPRSAIKHGVYLFVRSIYLPALQCVHN